MSLEVYILLGHILTGITDEVIKNMKDATPEEKHHMSKIAVEITNVSIQLLRESPEFRDAFSRIHSEFFKYPESESVIRQAIMACDKFVTNTEYTN
jgi:ferritin-like protein